MGRQGTMMGWRRSGRGWAAALLAVLVAGCASMGSSDRPLPPPRTLQPADLAGLAGEWAGVLRGTPGSGSLGGRSTFARVSVAPDGTYTTNIGGLPGSGRATIEGGRIVFEGSVTRGTATLYEVDGRSVLKGEGTWVGLDGTTEFELTRR